MSDVTSFHVTGDWRHIIDDGMVDLDALPDETLPTGKVEFTPIWPTLAVAGTPTVGYTLAPVTALIAAGQLRDLQGREGVWLAGQIGEHTVQWRAAVYLEFQKRALHHPSVEFELTTDMRLSGIIDQTGPGLTPVILDPRIEALAQRVDEVAQAVSDAQGHAQDAQDAADSFGVTVGSSTGTPGAPAAVTITGDGPTYHIDFVVPEGEKGDKGDPGDVSLPQLDAAVGPIADEIATGRLSEAALNATYGRKVQTVDIRDFILPSDTFSDDGDGDCQPALQRLVNELKAANDADPARLPVQIYFPNGTYRLDSYVWLHSKIGIKGESEAGTIFLPPVTAAAFRGEGTAANPLRDNRFSDFTIDASRQTFWNYDASIKGIYMLYMLRPRWERLTMKNTWATSIGCDYLVDYRMDQITVYRSGRGIEENTGVGPYDPKTVSGGSGIGIGTGGFEYERGVITSPTFIECGKNGLFAELLGTSYGAHSKGPVVTGLRATGCHVGFHDCGWDGAEVSGVIEDSTYAGVLLDNTILTPHAGVNGRFNGTLQGNKHGIVIGAASLGGYTFDGVNRDNVEDGVYATDSAVMGRGFTFRQDVYGNGRNGYNLRSSAPVRDLTITGAAKNNGVDGVVIEAETDWLTLDVKAADTRPEPQQQRGVRIVGRIEHGDLRADARGNTAEGYRITEPFTSRVDILGGGTETPPPVMPLIADSFNRTNSTTGLGSTDGGTLGPLAWEQLGAGVHGISNGQARIVSGFGSTVVNPGQAAVTVEATLAVAGLGSALVFRAQDDQNLCALQIEATGSSGYALETRTAGTRTIIPGGKTDILPQNGDRVKVVDRGDEIEFWLNDVLRATVTSSAFAAATKVGLQGNANRDAAVRWDNFKVSPTVQ